MAFLTELLRLAPGDRVLDVGCGPGRHALALRSGGVEVVGIDISHTFLRAAGEGCWARADARRLPFPSSSFDAVISLCQGGFGLLGGAQDCLVIAEMARVLANDGRMALSAFSAYFAVRYLEEGDEFDAGNGVNHERASVRSPTGEAADFDLWTTCFTPRELRLMLAGSGLDVDELWSVGPGDYARRAADVDHPEWLVVAHRPNGAGRPPV